MKLPVSILAVVAVLVALVGIRLDSSALFFFGSLGLFTVGWLAVCSVTLCRFHCPECGQRVPFKLPPLGEPIVFPCPRCRVIWTTGMDHTQAD
ncbi:MAG: hypothetical protein IT580_14890 [Verrucomicrobiales bacterium]|nr:hypothetical protein [Verrucomicrobiales bacterium]